MPLFEVRSVLHQNLQPLFAVYFVLAIYCAVDRHGHVRLYLILAVAVQRQVQGRLCVFGTLGRIVSTQDTQAFLGEGHFLDPDADLDSLTVVGVGISAQRYYTISK